MHRVIHQLDFPNTFKRRMDFAVELDNEPTVCWAELVMWVFGYTEFESCFYQGCEPGKTFCGKCDRSGYRFETCTT